MQALILAGGYGTRLRPLTLNIPKAIVPIGNRPFLFWQIQLLKAVGVKDIILSTGYQPDAIRETLGDGSNFGVNIQYVVEPTPMGTAGAYKFAEDFLNTTTIILNGDILTDIDLQAIVNQHKTTEALATMILIEVDNPSGYGLVKTDNDNRVLSFIEKPSPEQAEKISNKNINSGIYILEPEILNYIPEGETFSFEYQLFPYLLSKGINFRGVVVRNSYWLDIGTPERYLQANNDLLNGKINYFDVKNESHFQVPESAEIDQHSYIDDGSIIKNGARILNSVIGKNVTIGENSVIQNSVIWSDTVVDSHAEILSSIIGNNCHIGKNVKVGKNSTLGDSTIVPDLILH